jgi:hypothetical protein
MSRNPMEIIDGVPEANVTEVENGPRYTCTSERLSGVVTKALEEV